MLLPRGRASFYIIMVAKGVVAIVGCGKGLGGAIANKFAAEGYRVHFIRMYPETRRELPLLCRAYGVALLRSIHSQHDREGSLARL